MLIDKLGYIFVTGRDNHWLLGRCSLHCQCANNIIGFNAVNDQHRQAHGFNNIVDWLYLDTQIIWHRWALSFVVAVYIIAKGFTLGIEHHYHRALGVIL